MSIPPPILGPAISMLGAPIFGPFISIPPLISILGKPILGPLISIPPPIFGPLISIFPLGRFIEAS